MSGPDPHGVTQLAQAIQRRFDPDAPVWWAKGTVTAVHTGPASVSVAVPGDTLTLAYLASYTPTVGDVVFCVGPPGQWLVLGRLAA